MITGSSWLNTIFWVSSNNLEYWERMDLKWNSNQILITYQLAYKHCKSTEKWVSKLHTCALSWQPLSSPLPRISLQHELWAVGEKGIVIRCGSLCTKRKKKKKNPYPVFMSFLLMSSNLKRQHTKYMFRLFIMSILTYISFQKQSATNVGQYSFYLAFKWSFCFM